jgi:hypothetical protein
MFGSQNLGGGPDCCECCSVPVTDNPRVKATGWMDLPGLGRKVGIFRLCTRCAAIREQYPCHSAGTTSDGCD